MLYLGEHIADYDEQTYCARTYHSRGHNGVLLLEPSCIVACINHRSGTLYVWTCAHTHTRCTYVCEMEISALPIEIVLTIFFYLDTYTFLSVVPNVCRLWRTVYGDTKDVVLSFDSDYPFGNSSPPWHRLKHVKEVRLLHHATDDTIVANVVRLFPDLRRFILGKSGYISDVGVSSLSGCRRLTHIDISRCGGITDTGVITLALHCPLLVTIMMGSGCSAITDESLVALGSNCPRLRCINMHACSNITDVGVMALAICPLVEIDLCFCEHVTDVGLMALARRCPDLVRIDCVHCIKFTDVGVMELARQCGRLECVDISYCQGISEASVIALAERCARLVLLDVWGCRITDESLLSLAKHTLGLKTIYISDSEITEKGMDVLAAGCHQLMSIDILHCENITRTYLTSLQKRYPSLAINTNIFDAGAHLHVD